MISNIVVVHALAETAIQTRERAAVLECEVGLLALTDQSWDPAILVHSGYCFSSTVYSYYDHYTLYTQAP